MDLFSKASLHYLKTKENFLVNFKICCSKKITLLILFFCSSCGYYFTDGALQGTKRTIMIPYIKGDFDGLLTNALIESLDSTGYYQYVQRRGEFLLEASIVSIQDTPIGYRYDREGETDELTDRLVQTEIRRDVIVEISLVEAATRTVLIPSFQVRANAEYDFIDPTSLTDASFINDEGKRETVLSFSLGQLDSIEAGQDNALYLAYRRLAKNIVRVLIARSKSL